MGKRKSGKRKHDSSSVDQSGADHVVDLLARVVEKIRDSPKYKASELCAKAWDLEDTEERLRLARQALALDTRCAQAHMLLAEHSTTDTEAELHLNQAVSCAEAELRDAGFPPGHPEFELDELTEDYFAARAALAENLGRQGRIGEAILHYEELLSYDEDDPGSIRHELAVLHMCEGRDNEADAVLRRFRHDGSSATIYIRALLAFRGQGDSLDARKILRRALATNIRVAEMLCMKPKPGIENILDELDDEVLDELREAFEIMRLIDSLWRDTPDAVAWVAEHWTPPKLLLSEPIA